MKIETSKLMTIKNFAMKEKITPAYIYKLIKEQKMRPVEIDGVRFIDTDMYPTIPVQNRR